MAAADNALAFGMDGAYTIESGYVLDAPAEFYTLFGHHIGMALNDVVPEPATLSLLAVGATVLIRTRRRL